MTAAATQNTGFCAAFAGTSFAACFSSAILVVLGIALAVSFIIVSVLLGRLPVLPLLVMVAVLAVRSQNRISSEAMTAC